MTGQGHEIKRSSYGLPVPRELLLDAGQAEPTPAEQAEAERQASEARRRDAEAAVKLEVARHALASIADPLTRAVLDLHSEDERGECEGDDFDGYGAEHPEWPCRTVETIAAHYGIDLAWRP